MPTLLVVEPDPNNRRYVRVNLEARGYETTLAATPAEALELVRQTPPSALVLNVYPYEEAALSLLDTLSHDPRLSSLPVIVVSGTAADRQRFALRYDNVFGVLVKPVRADLLVRTVNAAVSSGGY